MAPQSKRRPNNNQQPENSNSQGQRDGKKLRRCSKKKNGKRGPTQMKKIIKNKVIGKKEKVKANWAGQPIGKGGKNLQSYLGVLARSLIPVNIKTWHQVKDDKRDKIWAETNLAFHLDEKISREFVLKSVGRKCREFRTNLSKEYIQPYVDEPQLLDDCPDALDDPPEDYPEIEPEHWTDFVNSRTTKEFQEYRKLQQERHANLKYPHRMARKGYANTEHEIQKERGMETPMERGELWVLGRQNINGEFIDDDSREIANRINELQELRDAGEIQEIGSNDVLTQALRTGEHGGIVRGKGFGVKPSEFFKKPIGGMKELQEQQIKYEKEIVARLEAKYDDRLKRLEALVAGKNVESNEGAKEATTQKNSARDNGTPQKTTKGDDLMQETVGGDGLQQEATGETVFVENVDKSFKEVKCKLTVDNKIVAEGHIIATSGVIHGKELGISNYRVSVDKIIIGEAQLPIPIPDEMTTVQDAKGAHVAWPRNFVILTDSEGQRDKFPQKKKRMSPKEPLEKKSLSPKEPQTQPQEKEKVLRPSCIQPAASSSSCARPGAVSSTTLEIPPNLPGALRTLAKSVRKKDRHYMINIPIEATVFGGESGFLDVAIEDIMHMALLDEIGATTIAVYMRHLYNILEAKERLHLFGFIHPEILTTFKDDIKHRAKSISARMLSTKARYWLAPYNFGRHWTLLAIDMRTENVYYFDSLKGAVESHGDIQSVIRMALLLYNSQKLKVGKSKPHWSPVICPKQPDSVQCGYYVMRNMKELVLASKPTDYIEHHCKKKKTYTLEEINEIREEWTDCVTDYQE